MNLFELIRDYKDTIRRCKDDDLAWIRAQGSLAEVIGFAAMARTRNNKRHPHQRRLPESAMGQGRDVLLANQDAMRKCRTFDDLLQLVEDFLCIYKGQLAGKPGSRRGSCKPPSSVEKGKTSCTW